jgi:hypothetical protein
MKKISPRMGEVAKEVAKTLAKVVGKGLAVGGGLAALGLGMAGCESTPPAPAPVAQTFEGPVVDIYNSSSFAGNPRKAIVVDTDGNLETTADQKHILASDEYMAAHPSLITGVTVRFSWDQSDVRDGIGSANRIILIDGKFIQH